VNAPVTHVLVHAPARLHLGFLDPDGHFGRRFGAIGCAVSGLDTVVSACRASDSAIEGAVDERAKALFESAMSVSGNVVPIRMTVQSRSPQHAGLGSGTQLALAIDTAVRRLAGQPCAPGCAAKRLGRGLRSGTGAALFEHGGLVVDGGVGDGSKVPPLVSRLALPDDWRVVLVRDEARQGLSGAAEKAAFRALQPLPEQTAGELCHRVLLGLLPAAAEGDFGAFSKHLGVLQEAVGSYFADSQGGLFLSEAVSGAVEYCRDRFGLSGTGQSSWGPTGFIFAPDQRTGERVVEALSESQAAVGLILSVHAPDNTGARVSVTPAPRSATG